MISCLEKIQQLGILHIDQQHYESENITSLHAKLLRVAEILKRMEILALKQPYQSVSSYDLAKIDSLYHELFGLISEEQKNNEDIVTLQGHLDSWSAWGEFDPALICELRRQDIYIHLFTVLSRHLPVLMDSSMEYFTINRKDDLTLVALIDRGLHSPEEKRKLFDALPPEIDLPECSIAELKTRIQNLKERNAFIEKILRNRLYERNTLFAYSQDLADQLEFEKARFSLEDLGDEIYLLNGYVPESDVNNLKLYAKNYSFGLVLRDIELKEGEHPPTKLKQNFISRLINPILSFLEVTPAYHEPDISLSFFCFFTIFVAMIMSDAAYGLAILLLGLTVQFSIGRCNTFVQMLYVLGGATFVWGTASGSWFGSEHIASIELFKHYSVKYLSVYPELFDYSVKEQQEFIIWLCFSLGALHLIVAHLWRGVREVKRERLKALANLGMIAMINGLYWLLLWMVQISQELPSHVLPSLALGLAITILFGQQDRSFGFLHGILKGIKGLFTTFLDTVGLFGDIMSYIRLFAVGIASFSIASSFNGMGFGIISTSGGSFEILFFLAGIFVWILGHVINFVLGCLSVIVHAVRLNMLEFSNHIGLEWTGYKYQPFIKRSYIKK